MDKRSQGDTHGEKTKERRANISGHPMMPGGGEPQLEGSHELKIQAMSSESRATTPSYASCALHSPLGVLFTGAACDGPPGEVQWLVVDVWLCHEGKNNHLPQVQESLSGKTRGK